MGVILSAKKILTQLPIVKKKLDLIMNWYIP